VAERVPAPLRAYRTTVRPEWTDYNGHLNDGCYAVVLSEANELLLELLGVSAEYRRTTGRAMFTVEAHLRFLAEAAQGEVLEAESLLVDADTKRLRVHTLLRSAAGRPVATGEHLYLHVDADQGQVEGFPAAVQRVVARVLAAHAGLERPAHLGLGVGARPAPRPV